MESGYSIQPRVVDLPRSIGDPEANMFAGPSTLSDREQWRAELAKWRESERLRLNYADDAYCEEPLASKSLYSVALIWLWDELLFDYKTQKFTPNKLLADSMKFGGVDGIILWHAYPVIGIDDRNQFDFYQMVPGLKDLVQDFHDLDVQVYVNYNPWDRWTARAEGSDQMELAKIIGANNFDGLFLDTLKSVEPTFLEPILAAHPGLIIGGESKVQQERICDHVMSWAQWFADSEIPGVIRAKWFEPRHILHQTRRWNRSHLDELFIAWLNGAGMLIWESVFGSWVGWNERDISMWAGMVEVLRDHHLIVTTGSWEPLTMLSDVAEAHGLFASKFEKAGTALFTIINKNVSDFDGEIIPGLRGVVLGRGASAVVNEGGVLRVIDFHLDGKSERFPQHDCVRVNPLQGETRGFAISFRNRESDSYGEASFVNAWKPMPPYLHQIRHSELSMQARLGKLDHHEVSNSEYSDFLLATGYFPKHSNRFLQHWVDGKPLPKDLDSPVVYIDLDDAMAFAMWKGLEIPTEWEWQLNSAGIDHRIPRVWNLTDSVHSDGRTRFMILKGGSDFDIRQGQGNKSPSGLAESDWYVDGGAKDSTWVEKLLLMGLGMSRSENIGFRCFKPMEAK